MGGATRPANPAIASNAPWTPAVPSVCPKEALAEAANIHLQSREGDGQDGC